MNPRISWTTTSTSPLWMLTTWSCVLRLQISLHRGLVDRKFQIEGVTPTNHSSPHKTRLNNLSYSIRMRAQLSFVLSQITRLSDGQTDGILIARPRLHSTQRGKMVYLLPDVDKQVVSVSTRDQRPEHVLQTYYTRYEHVHMADWKADSQWCMMNVHLQITNTRCSAIAERPRCRVRYSFRQK